MKELTIGCWNMVIDVERTREYYLNLPTIAEDCGCDGCVLYSKVVSQFPEKLQDIINLLGIDIRKPFDTFDLASPECEYRFASYFHVFGYIISGRDAWKKQGSGETIDYIEAEDFSYGFTTRVVLADSSVIKDMIQFEFSVGSKIEDLGS